MGTFNKRITAAVLFVLLAVTQTAMLAAQSGSLGENVSWNLSGGTLTVSGNGPIPNATGAGHPWSRYEKTITRIIIENGITAIGNSSFSGCVATSVSIPNGVTSIGLYAFSSCAALTSVVIPDSVTILESYAFSGCRTLVSVTIGKGITHIAPRAFEECGFTEITIPEGVTIIGGGAFLRCPRLTTVYFNGANVADHVAVDVRVFEECNSLKTVIFGDSVRRIPKHILTSQKSLENVTIGNNVTHIGDSAFNSCGSLSSVTIGRNVTEIGTRAFMFCTSLRSITIPDSVSYISNSAFYECINLASATIGKGVSQIMPGAFGRTGLTEITIPEGITELVNSPFTLSNRLRTVYWNVPTTADFASTSAPFFNCIALTEVVIGDNVRRIPKWLFGGVDSLEKITIGSRVTQIEYMAFGGLDNLTEIISKAARPPRIDPDGFRGIDKSYITLQVPAASLSAYKADAFWKDFQFVEEAAHGR